MSRGLFGSLFDFDNDGSLDAIEGAADFAAFAMMMDEIEKEKREEKVYDTYAYMDEEERREAMEADGLDPDDFDF